MAIDFPNSPVQGTSWTQGVNTWIYDGSKWNIEPTTIQGIDGRQGIQGIQGITGFQGTQGIQGIQGVIGIQGQTGIQGQGGNQGIQGIQGTTGLQGVQGLQGRQGIQGFSIQGTQGTAGSVQGPQGLQGIQGIQGTLGLQGIQGITGTQGLQGTQPSSYVPMFSRSGTLVVATGTHRFYVESAATISKVRAAVGTAPTGASLILDVNKNGTTIYTTQANRPTITAGTNTATANTIDVTSLASGDYLTVDIDQIGSTVAGSDLTVIITLVT